MDAVSRECVVTVELLSRWRDDFIAAKIAGLKGKTLEEVRIVALECLTDRGLCRRKM